MAKDFSVGDRVRVIAMPPYVKTADPMPMLRPPQVIHLGEEGVILDQRPGGYWGVRFTKGAFLIESQYIESAIAPVNDQLDASDPLHHDATESSGLGTVPNLAPDSNQDKTAEK